VDSIKLEEKDYFLNGQFHVKIIGDSLLGVSSVKSPSVAFYHVNGKQRKRMHLEITRWAHFYRPILMLLSIQ